MLGVAPDSVTQVEVLRKDALSNMTKMTSSSAETRHSTSRPTDTDEPIAVPTQSGSEAATPQSSSTLYSIGDLVALQSDPETVMPIIGIVAGGTETRYQVFHNNRQAAYYESQLRPAESNIELCRLNADELTSLPDQSASACAVYRESVFVAFRTRSVRTLSVPPCFEIDPCGSSSVADRRRSGRRQDN